MCIDPFPEFLKNEHKDEQQKSDAAKDVVAVVLQMTKSEVSRVTIPSTLMNIAAKHFIVEGY